MSKTLERKNRVGLLETNNFFLGLNQRIAVDKYGIDRHVFFFGKHDVFETAFACSSLWDIWIAAHWTQS